MHHPQPRFGPWFGVLLLIGTPSAAAYELDRLEDAAPTDVQAIAADALAAWQFRPQGPALLPGAPRVQLAGHGQLTGTDDGAAWRRAVGADVDRTGVVGFTARLRLGERHAAGSMAAVIPDTEAQLYGIELRSRLLDGDGRWPTLELRASGAWMTGTDRVDWAAQSVELIAAETFGCVTPYAGAGHAWGQLDAGDDAAGREPRPADSRWLAGVVVALPAMDVVVEGDLQDGRGSLGLSLRFGWGAPAR